MKSYIVSVFKKEDGIKKISKRLIEGW